MRTSPMRFFSLLMTSLLSTAALADDWCTVEAGPRDVVKRTGDITIEEGQVVDDAVALDGRVTVKRGAVVKNAVSFRGDVVIERGARVKKSAVAIAGRVKVAAGARVNNSVEISEKGLKVRGDEGEDLDLNLTIGGKSLGQRIADEAIEKFKSCRIVSTK